MTASHDFESIVIELESYYVSLKHTGKRNSTITAALDKKLHSENREERENLFDENDYLLAEDPTFTTDGSNTRDSFIDEDYSRCGIVEPTTDEDSPDEFDYPTSTLDSKWSGFIPKTFVKSDKSESDMNRESGNRDYNLANYYESFTDQCIAKLTKEIHMSPMKVQKCGNVLIVSPPPDLPPPLPPKRKAPPLPPKGGHGVMKRSETSSTSCIIDQCSLHKSGVYSSRLTLQHSRSSLDEFLDTSDDNRAEVLDQLSRSESKILTRRSYSKTEIFTDADHSSDYDSLSGSDESSVDKLDTMEDLLLQLGDIQLLHQQGGNIDKEMKKAKKSRRKLQYVMRKETHSTSLRRNLITELNAIRDDSKIWSLDQLMNDKVNEHKALFTQQQVHVQQDHKEEQTQCQKIKDRLCCKRDDGSPQILKRDIDNVLNTSNLIDHYALTAPKFDHDAPDSPKLDNDALDASKLDNSGSMNLSDLVKSSPQLRKLHINTERKKCKQSQPLQHTSLNEVSISTTADSHNQHIYQQIVDGRRETYLQNNGDQFNEAKEHREIDILVSNIYQEILETQNERKALDKQKSDQATCQGFQSDQVQKDQQVAMQNQRSKTQQEVYLQQIETDRQRREEVYVQQRFQQSQHQKIETQKVNAQHLTSESHKVGKSIETKCVQQSQILSQQNKEETTLRQQFKNVESSTKSTTLHTKIQSTKKSTKKIHTKKSCGKTKVTTLVNQSCYRHQNSTPLTRLRFYEFKRQRQISLQLNHNRRSEEQKALPWMDNTHVRVYKNEHNEWNNTPLFHPFWYECMSLAQKREDEKQKREFVDFKVSKDESVRKHNTTATGTRSLSYYNQADDMISIFKYFCSMNGTLTKDHTNALKKFLLDMRNKNFDDIKLATYRTAAKVFFIQKTSKIYLVDIYNIIEAFRENGLNTLDSKDEIDEPRLECIIASIYYSLYKRLPATQDIDVEKSILILTQWIMHAYDSDGVGRIRVLSVKTALSTLCEGRMVDKFRYIFTQISESNGVLNMAKLDHYLRDLLTLPSAVGEEPNFGYSDAILDSFFHPNGPLDRNTTKLDEFLDVFLSEKSNGILFWLHMLNKISKASQAEHETQCKGCGIKNFSGLRYKCMECYSYNMCQDCYWRDRITGTHKVEHTSREFSTWNKNDRGTSVRKKLLCAPTKSQHQRLPNYPKEPELNKTLDMSNIVPPLPSEPNSPMSTLQRTPRTPRMMNGSNSQYSTLQRGMSGGQQSQFSTLQRNRKTSDGQYSGPPSPMSNMPRLATARNEQEANLRNKKLSTSSEPSNQQKEILTNLEEKNRSLLNEIRKLKQEHEEAVKNAQQMGCDPNLLTELRVLRQRKDELEMRMSALQETRRELMVQLEGLMKLLKNHEISTTPRQMRRTGGGDNPRDTNDFRSPKTSGTSTLMRGVNGDVKEAFGKTSTIKENQDLRVDLMSAVDDVTSAMATVVTELANNRGSSSSTMEPHNEENDNVGERDERMSWSINGQTNRNSNSVVTSSNTQVSVY
ncbi:uncharacterized protein [Clytia hemisphaerica]|uniref:uncharacterized protein isoform X2 n=1 Tax=Clytia hemisphaerica TaxID=252671 RepID=UPI0034D6D4F0